MLICCCFNFKFFKIQVPYEPQSPNTQQITDSPTELLVSWERPLEPNGIITSYKVYCYETESSDAENKTDAITTVVSGTVTQGIVAGLTPYTFYDCYVTANTSIGEGNISDSARARTDESSKHLLTWNYHC